MNMFYILSIYYIWLYIIDFIIIYNWFQTDDRDIDFDVETAIRVCRSAGYHKHALSLSERHHRHDWYLKVQLEDNLDYTAALKYISKLPFEEVNLHIFLSSRSYTISLVSLRTLSRSLIEKLYLFVLVALWIKEK